MTNPYESSAIESGTNMPHLNCPELYQPLSKWMTIPVGLIVGGIGSGFFAFVLALLFFVLLGQMIGFTFLDQLWVYGLPILLLSGVDIVPNRAVSFSCQSCAVGTT